MNLWLASVGAVAWRGYLRTIRVPGLLIVITVFPAFFLVAFTGLYPSITNLPGFPTDDIENWFLPFSMLQGAAFSGLGAGFMTGNDIDEGFFDRLLLMPAGRSAIAVGTALASLGRALAVSVPVFVIGLAIGARLTGGVLGLVVLVVALSGLSIMSSCFALGIMYRAQDQRVAPLFQIGIFVTLFTSTAQVPLSVATGWLQAVARVNPITAILRLARQAFLDGGVTWGDTWPGLAAITGAVAVLGTFALLGLRRFR